MSSRSSGWSSTSGVTFSSQEKPEVIGHWLFIIRSILTLRAKYAWIVFALFISYGSMGQLVGEMDDESKLYAESKQVNQFFRRFNGEEDEKGNRYYPGDKPYHSDKLRKKYLGILFDENNNGISHALKT